MNLIKRVLCGGAALMMLGSVNCRSYELLYADENDLLNTYDIHHLLSAFFGKNEITSDEDINGDNMFNILDMIEMKKRCLDKETQTGDPLTSDYKAVSENVKLIGRTYNDNDVVWLVQSGSAAEFNITGTSAELTLAGDSCVNSSEQYQPRYAVFADGELLDDRLLDKKEKKVKLFESSSQKTVNIKVIHLSESNNGAVGIKNIEVTSSLKAPVRPAARKDLSIEFIGDSITCGYGVEAQSNSESFKTSTENFMKSYAYLAAQKLGADYSAVSYSGYGVISGYTTSGEKNEDSVVPDYYGLAGKMSDYAHEWDFDSYKHDVVYINLGTNDDTYLKTDYDKRSPEFIEGYIKFLKTVREKNPDSHIICTVGTMGCYEVYDLIEKAVSEFKDAAGDEKIMCYRSTTQTGAYGYGADWHPSAMTQQMSAYVAADKICEALGIQSDKIGLDAAENAEYSVEINKESGAYAANYLGYDKSFWVNMSTGGSKPSDVQACISGIELRAGGEYRLEFDCTANKNISMPVSVRQNYGDKLSYFNDTVEVTDKKEHYSMTFSLENNDKDCAVVFDVGGLDYYNVTFSNVTLRKMS